MTTTGTRRAAPQPAVDPRTWPWWVQVLAVYAAARAVSAVLLIVAARAQEANAWTAAHPSYAQLTGLMWDASWYRTAAEDGYPATLPRGADGLVEQNVWAFFPLFPFLVRGLMELTRGPWEVVAPTTALLLGAAAVLVVHRLVAVGAPRAVAARPGLPLATVTLLSVFPTAPVLQVAYTESAALLLVALALLLLVRRRYLATALVVLALGFTRPVALPMAAVVVVHAAARWWTGRARLGAQAPADRRGAQVPADGRGAQVPADGRGAQVPADRFGARDLVGLLVLTASAAVSGVLWPALCGWVTGEPDGYLQTQEAWRGLREVTPFGAWGYVGRFWFGDGAPLVLLAAFAFVALCLLVPAAWRLGPELHAWPAAYLLYLAAVVEPGSSLARFLLLAFPLGAATAGVVARPAGARRVWLSGVVLLMLVLQAVWVWSIWRMTPPSDWPP